MASALGLDRRSHSSRRYQWFAHGKAGVITQAVTLCRIYRGGTTEVLAKAAVRIKWLAGNFDRKSVNTTGLAYSLLLARCSYSAMLIARHKAVIHGQLRPSWSDRPVWPSKGPSA